MAGIGASNLNPLDGLSPSSDAAHGSSKLGKDEFMKLLMAQMSNQDPLQPQDGQAFVAQLAQFSNLEQLQSANQSLQSLLLLQAGMSQTSDAALVGKQVLYTTSSLSVDQGHPADMQATLDGSATQVTAVITDSSGKTVRTLNLGSQSQGQVHLGWDGRDDQGRQVSDGAYTVKFVAVDGAGHGVNVTQAARGLVDAVSFKNGYAELLIGSERVKLADVQEIGQPSS
mgnify:CR=1 FL=1